MTARLAAAFGRAKAEGRPALVAYVIPGFPGREESVEVLDALVAGGADVMEVGIPFSDPLADGATIQKAAFQALAAGTTPAYCLDFAREARKRHPELPLVFMTYLNPVLAYGLEAFAVDAAKAGADGAILVDLPVEEADDARRAFSGSGLDLVCLVAPTSSDERIRLIASKASGFIYCVSVAGVTGARSDLSKELPELVARVRDCTNLPVAVGFGVSRREHVEALSSIADGVVVGSAFVDLVASTERHERAKVVREYTEVLSGRRGP